VIWSERVARSDPRALDLLGRIAATLDLAADGAGLIEVPEAANGRGLREVGCLPGIGPGFSDAAPGMSTPEIRDALAAGDLDALWLFDADPIRDFPGGPSWSAALGKARFVLAVSMFENASTAHADVVFPAESHAEKEGTVTHPDGRLQRLRPNIPHVGDVRLGWEVLAELSARLGDETGIDSAPEALAAIASEVPFYAGVTPEEIGGLGVRWQERDAAAAFEEGSPVGAAPSSADSREGEPASAGDSARVEASAGAAPTDTPSNGIVVGTYRDLWAGEVSERNPSLRFLKPKQTLEIAPTDAARLGIGQGEDVEVRSNGTSVRARAAIRERIRPGSAFLIEGTAEQNANALAAPGPIAVTKAVEE
jgi:NADH-quinone oxidoreductase subunit G